MGAAAFAGLTQAVAMPVAGLGRARVVLLFATRAGEGFAPDALAT